MKKQVATEWTRLYWAAMAIAAWVILSSLFGCSTERITLTRTEAYMVEAQIARYWFVMLLLACASFGLYLWRKNKLALFLACMLFLSWATPYLMMFGIWVLINLIP